MYWRNSRRIPRFPSGSGWPKELILPESSTEERLFLLAAGEHAMLFFMYVALPASREKHMKNTGFSYCKTPTFIGKPYGFPGFPWRIDATDTHALEKISGYWHQRWARWRPFEACFTSASVGKDTTARFHDLGAVELWSLRIGPIISQIWGSLHHLRHPNQQTWIPREVEWISLVSAPLAHFPWLFRTSFTSSTGRSSTRIVCKVWKALMTCIGRGEVPTVRLNEADPRSKS